MFLNPIRKLLVAVIVLCSVNSFFAQENDATLNVEEKSYQLYLDKNWTELIKLVKLAEKKGYNYFYLQMRIGIAYFEKKNYLLAEERFLNALKFNSDDELALEYLYYCYVYTGKNEAARVLSKSFSKDLAEKTKTLKQSSIGFIMLEGGTKISDSVDYYDVNKHTRSNYFDPATYVQFGLNHYIKRKVSLFHAASFYSQQNFVGNIKQAQYYISGTIPVKNNWLFSPAFHLIHLKFKSEAAVTPTVPPGAPPPPAPTPTYIINENYVVGSFTAQKKIRKFTMALGTTFSNMSNVNQLLHSGFVSYAPFGNASLVFGGSAYLHTTDSYSSVYTSYIPFVYIQPHGSFSLKGSFLINQQNNIIEDNGYLVNNSPDLTKTRGSLLLNFNLTKHLSLYGLYQLEFKQEMVQQFNYRYNVIVGGLKFTP